MNNDSHKDLQAMSKNRHGLVTIVGIIVCVLLALVAGRDIIFGLVMGTVMGSGMNLGRHIAGQIAENAPSEHQMTANIAGILISGIIVGIITALILSAIQGAVDVSPAEGDDIIATIVKSFFDSAAALAVAAGLVVGGWAHRRSE